MSIRAAGLLALLAPALSLAGYHNLIATTDGGSVYFAFSTTPAQNNSFVAQKGVDGAVTLIDSGVNIVDINGSGSVVARSQYATLVRVGQCVSGLSGCFDAAPCIAYFQLTDPHSEFSAIERPTFVRLNESGSSFFVRQPDACVQSGSNPDLVPLLPTGIHPLSDPHSNLALADVVLATRRIGRRAMTNSDRALVFDGAQLQWLDATGRANLLQFASAFEAVTDSKGDNIVYTETEVGMLHWISGASLNGGIDEVLNLIGSAPALSSDGQSLVYRAEDQTLHFYQRSTRATTQLGSDAYSEFTLAGNQYVFGVTAGGRLDRIDLVSGTVEQWLQPSLAIDPASITPGVSRTSSTFYYGPPPVYLEVGPGEIVNFSGSHFDAPGWRVRLGDRDLDWHVEASNFAWIQIPSDVSPGSTSLQWIAPDQPLLNYRIQVTIGSGLYYCNAPYHQDLSGFVTPDNPAVIGEVIHYYLSGLAGVEFVADGTPNPIDHPVLLVNPPSLADPPSYEVQFLGLAPGQIGLQQMDLRVKQPSNNKALFVNGPASCVAPATGS